MNRFPLSRALLLLAALACAACGGGGGDTSLRDALDALPQDTGSDVPAPAEVDTTPPGSASAPVLFPEPRDTAPWIPEREMEMPAAAGPGEWTVGIVASERPTAPMATLRSVRAARHPEYDRVVLEFAGEELPGYHLEYVDRPIRECGSGETVEVAGDAWLSVRLSPAQAHDDRGRPTVRERTIRPSVANILELRRVCDFEGQVEWIVGVRSPGRYRVLELFDPGRIVVDVEE
jgi:hypothetical protein